MVDTRTENLHVAVVGGGIAGLAAAWSLVHDHGVHNVTVLESAPQVGGKVAVAEFAGLPVDIGAEAMLATRPEAVEFAQQVGLAADVIHATTASASVLVDGVLKPLPVGTVMGVPTDMGVLARSGIFDATALARIPLDHVMARTEIGADISIGDYVTTRLGPQVVDRLVAPLLGGVYAGAPEKLSMRSTVPALFAAAVEERSLLAAARSVRAAAPAREPGQPVFAGIAGGVGRLAGATRTALVDAGVQVRTGATVRELAARPHGWRLTLGSVPEPEFLDVDLVILATPAPATRRLLQEVAPRAAGALADIEYASVATVLLAYRAQDLVGPDVEGGDAVGLPAGSGFLVPPSEPRHIKAATYSSQKWGWLGKLASAQGLTIIRSSLGRIGEVAVLQRDDDEIAALAHADLAFVLRLGASKPVAQSVTRWGGALPQYDVGHSERVRTIRDAVEVLPGLAVCGAAYDGVGIPACIASARLAVEQALATGVATPAEALRE